MKKILFLVFFLAPFLFLQAQTKINNITFPDTYTSGKDKLLLNGGGTREKYWMDMYVGALYLPAKSKDAPAIVSANNSMGIRLCIVSGLITSEKMTEAVKEGFRKSTEGKQDAYKDKIAQFQKAFSEAIKKGDVFDIAYADETISIYKNNTLKAEIRGLDFKKAVFGIWLGKEPADEDLKEGMLGNSD
ncbi:MAG: chalcone isomerase [Bacteroidetes bacterium]|nr:MAG: chalcone isomerase [Bacteroidota bacterium]